MLAAARRKEESMNIYRIWTKEKNASSEMTANIGEFAAKTFESAIKAAKYDESFLIANQEIYKCELICENIRGIR
jgi:hypothetical protein